MKIEFHNQTVAVTGAAIGFGRSIALRFASLGARVHACDIAAEPLAELQAHGIHTDVVDLCDRAAARAWVGHIENLSGGAIDVLINNAGGVAGQAGKPFESVADSEWDRVVAINLGAAFATSQAATPSMKKRGRGIIINISSGAALQASLTGVQAYCASKHAVLGLTRQLAQELGPHGIRVNSVAPGFVRTNEATERQWAVMGKTKQDSLLNSIGLRRLGTAEDIADVTAYLASSFAGLINGQIIQVDGGR